MHHPSRVFLWFALLSLCACTGTAPLPEPALALNRAGAEALAAGQLELADARLSVALEYSPHFVEALVNLGLVELERGNFARSRQLFERARRLNPDIAQPHHGLGVLSERERRPDRASEHYRDALRVDPGFAAARANLGRLLFESGRLEEARITFQRLVESAPDEPAGMWGLAEALIRLGRHREADAIVNAAHARFPQHGATRLLVARTLLRAGRAHEAIEYLVPLVERRDDFAAAALAWLGTAELARGRPRHAVGAAERAIALEPEQPVATHVLAEALSQLDDPTAGTWRERALRMRAP
jgi:tetratricopeptide (TPR) repeat protein